VGPRDRPFAAHVTLGRARRGARVDLRGHGHGQGARDVVGPLRVDEVVLFESTLPTAGGRGPVHVARARARLGAAGQRSAADP
jgi:2'-5' RNA ligase